MALVTKRDLPIRPWANVVPDPQEVILPKGTEVQLIPGSGGGYAVKSERLLIELTGNTHDPRYRYVWVEATEIEEN